MPTKELRGRTESPDSSLGHEALTMALSIVIERIQRLPQSDQDDLFDLVRILPNADPEEVENCLLTIREILEQNPSRVHGMDAPSDAKQFPSGLKKWISFVSRRIASERRAAGLTQAQLAQKAGLPQSHVSRLESGKHSPSRATIEKIARALRKPVSAFDPSG